MVSVATAVRAAAGLAGSAGIAGLAARQGALTVGGAVAAVVIGTTTITAGGVAPGASLIAFFTTSTAWSRAGRERKAALADVWEKGDRRDAGQVLANGSVACVCLAVSVLARSRTARAAAAGALASAAADTWATELGSLARSPARLITTWGVVPRGTSGAITAPGCLAALAGGAFTATWFWCCDGDGTARTRRVVSTAIAGTFGSIVDSLIGATLQARYWCPACRRATERRLHSCGTAAVLAGGLPWVGNDVVNFAATAAGAVLGAALHARLGRPRRSFA